MNIEIFTLCEAATERQGQLCILHTFSNMMATRLPAIISGLIACQIRLRQHEEGDHTIEFVLVDSDGVERWRSKVVKLYIDVGNSQTLAYINITPMINVEVNAGQHDLRLLWDGQELASTPLAMLQAPSL